jgi:6-pyruvoyltetrahydropterin/6-carboxytetrahydropterin synthase
MDPLFRKKVPTTENLCRAIFGFLKDSLPAGKLEQVRVEETENNFFECSDESGNESANEYRLTRLR